MPVLRRTKDGKPGYQFGEKGAFYPYKPGDEEGRREARMKAVNQGRAMRANGWKGD